jgi:hypothetical protein
MAHLAQSEGAGELVQICIPYLLEPFSKNVSPAQGLFAASGRG